MRDINSPVNPDTRNPTQAMLSLWGESRATMTQIHGGAALGGMTETLTIYIV